MKWKDMWELLKDTAKEWYEGNTFQQGAALAYYAVFAIAPALVIALAIAGMVFGPEAAQGQLQDRLSQVVGPTIAPAIEQTLAYANVTGQGWLATVIGVVGLVLGSLGVFSQLQSTLDAIFQVAPKPGRGIKGILQDRAFSFLMVLSMGALLLATLVANAALTVITGFFPNLNLPGGLVLWHILRWVISLGLLTLLFALMYRVLPDVRLGWEDVWLGAGVTALLFTVGNFLIGLYLGGSGVASAYGAAGSLVIVLLWVNYSSQVVLFGAEFVKVHAAKKGQTLEPTANALRLSCQERVQQGRPSAQDVAGSLRRAV